MSRRLQDLEQENKNLRRENLELTESRERYRSIIDQSSDAMMTLLPPSWQFATGNPAIFRLFACQNMSEFTAQTPWSLSPERQPDGRLSSEKSRVMIELALRDGFVRFDWQHRRLNGEEFSANVQLTRIETAGEVFLHASVRDINDRILAEKALKESERKYVTLLDNLPGFSYRCQNDPAWTMIFVSKGCLTVTGYPAQDLIQNRKLSYCDLIQPQWRDLIWKKWQEMLARRETLEMEYPIIHANGETRWVWERGRGIYDEKGQLQILEGFITDITLRKQTEAEKEALQSQLLAVQKMESIGRLAGGVAHDFNNMLSIIQGQAELALKDAGPCSPLSNRLQQIMRTTERSASLVSQLLAFARKQTFSPRPIDLNRTVTDMLQMLRRLIGEDIDLVYQPQENLPTVHMDPSQINQILINLCLNARDAIHDVGKITVGTQTALLDEHFSTRYSGSASGQFIELTVSDDGCGIDATAMPHLFEPFFTTKGVGLGAGLGLATVYGIVQQNNGLIDVVSQPGQGSSFRIYLPASPDRGGIPASPALEQSSCTGRETVLLVEDEPDILELMTEMLERLDYTVIAADSPGKAIRLAREYPDRIQLLITDIVMPEMNGRDLAEKLCELFPELKKIYMSGYTADIIGQHGILDSSVFFIQKPFSIQELTAMVRKVLAGDA